MAANRWLPNTYKASLVKHTQFDNTGWGGPRQIRRLQHRAVLTFISKSVQMFCTKHLLRLCVMRDRLPAA